jgi:SAM-dependent methyltransferase
VKEYDSIADWYPSDRGRIAGVPEALRAVASLPPGSRILDLGCGNGLPLTNALLNSGFRVVGLDSSRRMLERFRLNLPDAPVVRGDSRECPFADRVFDGAISWGMIFHLTSRDQAQAFASIARVLKPAAPFLFTAGEVPGLAGDDPGITGTMNGVTFNYFAVADYRSFLIPYGFELVDASVDAGENKYFFARKTG